MCQLEHSGAFCKNNVVIYRYHWSHSMHRQLKREGWRSLARHLETASSLMSLRVVLRVTALHGLPIAVRRILFVCEPNVCSVRLDISGSHAAGCSETLVTCGKSFEEVASPCGSLVQATPRLCDTKLMLPS